MISYGGIELNEVSAALAAVARIPPRETFGFYRPKRLNDSSLDPRHSVNFFLTRGIQVGSYFNPWGASRWGYAHVIADQAMLNAIRLQVYADDDYQALPLVVDDDKGNSVTTDLWMLPAVPLQKIDANYNLFLIALVDDRYFWWERGGTIEVNEGTTTWAQLYDAIAELLDITLSYETVNSAYLKPGASLTARYEHLPMLLDRVASSVGQRIVRTLDGSYYARSSATALSLVETQADLYRKYAGGSLDLGVVDV